jgi:methylmalonyl-CoA mutase
VRVQAVSERSGVLGAMDTMYQRGKIQEESLYYETRKHDGTLALIGVNTFLGDATQQAAQAVTALIRSTEQQKQDQVQAVRAFQARHAPDSAAALAKLQLAAAAGDNVFSELLDAVKVCSLGQISHALYAVGGQFRRGV